MSPDYCILILICVCLWHHRVSYLTSFCRVCNVSACPNSTPKHMYISLQHSCGDGPTLNNFHSGLTDRQLPLSSRHSKGQWGRRKCDRKSVWQRESKKMSVDIWGEVGVFDSCGYVDSRYERVQQQIQIKHIWITDPRRITRRFWVWTGPFQLKGWTRPGSDSSHFPEDSTRPTTAG